MTGLIRDFLWMIIKWMLGILDFVYETLMTIATLDIFQNDFILNWYYVLCGFIALFVFLRLIVVVSKVYFNDEFASKASIINTFVRIGLITLVVALTPIAVSFIAGLAKSFLDNIGMLQGNADGLFSDTVASVLGFPNGADWRTLDINQKIGLFGDYKYDVNLLWMLLVSGMSCIGVLLVALQIGQRMFGIGYKFLISPWAIASLVTPDSNTFSQWATLITLDYVSNAGQVLLLFFVMSFLSTTHIQSLGFGVMAVMLIAGILSILSAPAGIAQLFGNDFGSASALQGIQTITYTGAMVKGGIGLAGVGAAKAGGSVKDGFSLGAYGIGKLMGMKHGLNTPLSTPKSNPFKSNGGSTATSGNSMNYTGRNESKVSEVGVNSGGVLGSANTVPESTSSNQGLLKAVGHKAYNSSLVRIKSNVKAVDNASKMYHFIKENRKPNTLKATSSEKGNTQS